MVKKTTGLVLGKFMPLHKGHELLLQFANNFVDQLYVIVDHPPQETIDGKVRCRWVKETVPNAEVFYLPHPMPQEPSEHPDFWNYWRDTILSALPAHPDYVIASEHYGFQLADVIGATFIPFDLKREIIPISATKIRKDAASNWDYLSAAARRDYLIRVCVFGPESTGKTTLCEQLAAHFNTVYVPEYARLLIEAKGQLEESDMPIIAVGQRALENSLVSKANRILLCDTDPLATSIWQRWLFSRDNTAINALAAEAKYDLYLLTEPDLPWTADTVRYFEGRGNEFFEDCINTLKRNKKRYVQIAGQGESRTQSAIEVIKEILNISNFHQS